MYLYAQLQDDLVVGISHLSGEVIADNIINITDLTDKPELGSTYDAVTNTFAPPAIVPIESQQSL